MKISKLPIVLCALAVGTFCLTVRADDNPAQAAARAALTKAMFDESAPPATNAPVANTPNTKEAKAQARAEAKAKKAAAEAKAKQEAAQAAAEAKAKQAASKPAANAKKETAAPAGQPTAAAPQPATGADKSYAGADLGMKPMTAPASPLSASKEERLAALLTKYKADQISPEEYHQQRAAILAEP